MPSTEQTREPRRVRRDLSSTSPIDQPGPEVSPEQPPRRLKLKITAIIIGSLLGLSSLALLALYLYIKATPLAGEAGGRINILILGVDKANKLSDTIMLASIDTNAKPAKLALISIPRDLYVNIPGYYQTRINSAYTLGEQNHYPGGGAALSEATIKQNIGTSINYYMALNFNGFKQLVDAVGGVDVNVKQTLDDPTYPNSNYSGFDPFHLSAGPHHLDGATALKYVRCRKGTCGNDYGRAARQQEVVLAVKDKVLKQVKHNPFLITRFWRIFQKNTDTNLSSWQLLKIGLILHATRDSSITQNVIDTSNYLNGVVIGGADVLVPKSGNFSDINSFIQTIFTQPPPR